MKTRIASQLSGTVVIICSDTRAKNNWINIIHVLIHFISDSSSASLFIVNFRIQMLLNTSTYFDYKVYTVAF